jgi:nucleoid-associated protein YejK
MPQSLTEVLEQRGDAYGDYSEQAHLAQVLKDCIRNSPTYPDMLAIERESLEMICTKLSRILTGSPHHEDSWVDITGYAQLVVDRLRHT